MVQINWMISNELEWFQMNLNDFKWNQINSNWIKWIQIISNEFKWLQVDSNKLKWIQTWKLHQASSAGLKIHKYAINCNIFLKNCIKFHGNIWNYMEITWIKLKMHKCAKISKIWLTDTDEDDESDKHI